MLGLCQVRSSSVMNYRVNVNQLNAVKITSQDSGTYPRKIGDALVI